MDFSVTAVILRADGKTVNNHPSHILDGLTTPLGAGVIFVGGFVEVSVFFLEAAVVKELLAEVCCKHLGVFQCHFYNEFIREGVGGLIRAFVGYKQVHGGLEQVSLV